MCVCDLDISMLECSSDIQSNSFFFKYQNVRPRHFLRNFVVFASIECKLFLLCSFVLHYRSILLCSSLTNTTTPLDTAIIHTTSINIIIHNSGFWQPENEISCWYLSSPGPQNSIKSFQHYLTQLAEMPDLEAGRSLDQQVQVHFETYLWIG